MTTVKMTVTANIKVTPEVREGLMLQYGFSKEKAHNDELVATAMLHAYLNPKLSDCTHDYYWDGVANLRGLISDIELEEES